jgi:hypothetical protein
MHRGQPITYNKFINYNMYTSERLGQGMSRLSRLDDILFPVAERPVFVKVSDQAGERLLAVPDKKAIVNLANDRVLGIVGRDYRLVTNRQAIDWGHECCRVAFPETLSGEWEDKITDAPTTGGHCFVDIIHKSAALDFSFVSPQARPDAFGPFIRVTNSYNSLRALAFDIGFFRKVCKNGMILPDTVIRFKFIHSRRNIGKEIHFGVAHDRLAKLKTSFGEYLAALRTCSVPRHEFGLFLRGVLSIRTPQPIKPNSREANEWAALNSRIAELCERYANELGNTAYAVFNAVTEFASHPPANRYVRRDRNSLQRLAGTWLSSFSQECRQPRFDVSTYLAKLTTT